MLDLSGVELHHARIERIAGGRWLLRDLGSESGCRVGGRRVRDRVLEAGDVIEIGSARFEYRDERPPRPKGALDNPWIANLVVVSCFLGFLALAFGVYWLWSGGREKMLSPRLNPAAAAPAPPTAPTSDEVAERIAQLAEPSAPEEKRVAAALALARSDDPRAAVALERAAEADSPPSVRNAATGALAAIEARKKRRP